VGKIQRRISAEGKFHIIKKNCLLDVTCEPTNAREVYASVLYTLYTSYMFQPLTCLSSGRCITKDRDTVKYKIKVFVLMHSYKILKLYMV
jgi:hypothetical protein